MSMNITTTFDCGISQEKEQLLDATSRIANEQTIEIKLYEFILVPRENFHSVFYWTCGKEN